MQKKIIALAVAGLMSGAAFAQSNVTISGVYDIGYLSAKNEGNNGAVENYGAGSNTATSGITFRMVEDLGGGMKAGAQITTEPSGNAGNATGAALANSQNFVFINGGFGEVSLGLRNNLSLTTAVVAQPFGTGMGSTYSGFFGRLNGAGSAGATNAITGAGTNASGTRDVRVNNSLRYDSPNFNGFTAGISMAAKNQGHVAGDSTGHQNIGLNYAGGPLNVSYAWAKFSNTNTGVTTDSGIKHNMLGANYNFGPATVYAGYTTSKGGYTTSGDTSARSMNIGAKYAVTSNIDLMANFTRVNDKTAANVDRKMNALGADYKFSKRTAAYVRYEGGDTNTNNGAAGKFTNYAAGLRHSF